MHAYAATVSQWVGDPSGTRWSNSSFYSALQGAAFVTGGAGHTLEASAEAITSAALANNTHFVMNSNASASALTDTEYTALTNWVRGGGILILFATGDASSIALANNVLNNLGSAIDVTTSKVGPGFPTAGTTGGNLNGSDTAVTNPSNNLTNQQLRMYQSNVLTGGSLLAANNIPNPSNNFGAALRVDNVNLGKVYVFGDSFASNFLVNGGGGNHANLQLFLNILSQGQLSGGGGGPTGDTPEPSSILLTALGIAGLAYWKRRH
jgi:hypothetical protein